MVPLTLDLALYSEQKLRELRDKLEVVDGERARLQAALVEAIDGS